MAKEMRLIAVDALKERIRQEPTDGMYTAEILEAIDEVPIVDAVEVVYCDECYMHDNCSVEMAFQFARVEKPFCCAGKGVMTHEGTQTDRKAAHGHRCSAQ